MIRLPVLSLLVLLVSMTVLSCEDYPYDFDCTCPHGGVIGGWDEPDDTTSMNQKDTAGGFSISVDNWNETEIHDIPL